MIIIGHPYPETIRAISDAVKVLSEKGVSIVPVSQIIKKVKLLINVNYIKNR